MVKHKLKKTPTDNVLCEKHEKIVGVPSLENIIAKYREKVEDELLLRAKPTGFLTEKEKQFIKENRILLGKIRDEVNLTAGGRMEIEPGMDIKITKINGKEAHYDLIFNDAEPLKDSVVMSGETINYKMNIFEFIVSDSVVKIRVYDITNEISMWGYDKGEPRHFEHPEPAN